MGQAITVNGSVTLMLDNQHLEAIVGNQLVELHQALNELHRRIDELVQRVDTQISHVNENLREHENRISDLESKVEDLPDLDGLDLQNLDSRVDDLENQMSKVEDLPDPDDLITTDNVGDVIGDLDIGRDTRETIADLSRDVKQLMKLRQVLTDALTTETV